MVLLAALKLKIAKNSNESANHMTLEGGTHDVEEAGRIGGAEVEEDSDTAKRPRLMKSKDI